MVCAIKRVSPSFDAYKLANEYRRSQGDKEDTGTYPVSQYQKLRYALEDADPVRAKAAVDKLIADENLPRAVAVKKVTQGFEESLFHSWTKNEAMDKAFKASLSPEDRLKVLQAEKQREQTWARFAGIMHLPPTSRRSGRH